MSQALSVVLVVGGFIALLIGKRRHPHGREALFVTKQAALAAAAAAAGSDAGEASVPNAGEDVPGAEDAAGPAPEDGAQDGPADEPLDREKE